MQELSPVKKYSNEEKVKACAYYNVIGNLRKVSNLIRVPYEAVKKWKQQPWWKIISKAVISAKQEELDIKLSAIIDESTDQLMDRIHNGDHKLTKMGQVKRVPMTGRDLAQAGLGVALEKREFLRGGGKAMSRGDKDAQKILESLKDTFEQLAQSVKKEKPVIEHESIEEAEFIEEEKESS